MSGHLFTDPVAARQFILAGNATLTLRSAKTHNRYTYKIRKAKDTDLWFVSHLIGQDNTSDYSYLGIITKSGVFMVTKKSTHMRNTSQFRAFQYAWQRLPSAIAPELEIWHEGRCGRCSRLLTVPESIASGFGPECINYV